MAKILVAYGVPQQKIPLTDIAGRPSGVLHFDPKSFKNAVRANFEAKLRLAITEFLRKEVPDIAHADYRFVPSATTLATVIKSGGYTHVVYYGHAVIQRKSLHPLKEITGVQLKHAFAGSTVKHFDIIGCQAGAIAAQLAVDVPGLDVGYLRGQRLDDFEVDGSKQLRKITIVPETVFHFSTPAAK